ncbi:MAG: AsmA family protein [Candidatus Nitrotoga sp.]
MKANKNIPATPPPRTGSYIKQALLGLYGVIGVTIATIGVFKVPFAEGYAKEYWRQALAGFVLLLMLIAGIISLAVYTFDANNFKSQIVDYVKTNMQRDLILEGDLKVTFFPKLGLDSNKITLSQRNSSKVFASIDNARFNIAWWPLLFKQLRIESVTLDHLHANIVRDKNGNTNFDDLLVADGSLSSIQFEIDNIHLQNSSVNFQDEAADIFLTMHDMNIETGRIADLIPSKVSANFRMDSNKPRIKTRIKLGTHLVFNLKARHFELANFEGVMEGEAVGINKLLLNFQGSLNYFAAAEKSATEKWLLDKFIMTVKGEWENRNLEAKLDIAKFQSEKYFSIEKNILIEKNISTGTALVMNSKLIKGDEALVTMLELPAFEMQNKNIQADTLAATFDLLKQGRGVQGKFSSPLSVNMEKKQLQLPALVSNFNISHALLTSKLTGVATGNFLLNLASQPAEPLAKLTFNSKIEDSNFAGNIELQDIAQSAYSFELTTSPLNLDKYLVADWGKHLQDDSLALSFDSLKTLNLRGKIQSDELKLAKIKVSKLLAEIRVDQSNLVIAPLSARLYGGTALGSINLAAEGVPKISLQQKLSGIQFDALLNDLTAGSAKLTGRGNLILDLSAAGNRLGDWRKDINGDISLAINRGSIAGINLSEALIGGKNQLGITDNETKGKHTVEAKFTEATAFTDLKATFAVLHSTARGSDFLLKSPLFTSNGESEIVLDSSTPNTAQPGFGQINFKLNTTVAPNLRRSKSGEFAELAGILIPMQITGPYTQPAIEFDFGAATGGNSAKLIQKNKARMNQPPASIAPANVNPAQANKTTSNKVKSPAPLAGRAR